ncbi:MAG TPA: preprotein translocase subunit SecE [Bacteroidales bacterium]|nr:preprotein translocase subunit SecE [Bacteroidales bacterium]HSA43851.1 preprotein translocase subunit SecE [Bacteroidales bacterium]
MAAFQKVKVYVKESYDELMHKVSWPTWSELQSSAIVVSIASLIIAIIVYLMDLSFSSLLTEFYNLF